MPRCVYCCKNSHHSCCCSSGIVYYNYPLSCKLLKNDASFRLFSCPFFPTIRAFSLKYTVFLMFYINAFVSTVYAGMEDWGDEMSDQFRLNWSLKVPLSSAQSATFTFLERHFHPAKQPLSSCKTVIFVLPNSHFCPANQLL